jgi:predicted RNase H-like HicB family nuclease
LLIVSEPTSARDLFRDRAVSVTPRDSSKGERNHEHHWRTRFERVFCIRMGTDYLKAAMAKAKYELLGGGEGFYGEIPDFQGLFAEAATLEGCRDELASTLEDWLLFRISKHLPLPVVDGLDLKIKESPALA